MDYSTEFHDGKGPYGNGRITVDKHGSSVEMEHWAFNVTEHGGIELPKFRESEPPREVWDAAVGVLLKNVPQNTSPAYRKGQNEL